MRILIVEDDVDLSNALRKILSQKGYEVLSAVDEEETEKVLSDHGDDISIAIVDMIFPAKQRELSINESGLRIIKLLTSKYPTIVSIVYTGNDEYKNAMKCMAAGASYYLEKESDITLLLDIIERAKSTTEDIRKITQSTEKIQESLQILEKQSNSMLETYQRIHDEIINVDKELAQIRQRGGRR